MITEKIDSRLGGVERRLDNIEKSVDTINSTVSTIHGSVVTISAATAQMAAQLGRKQDKQNGRISIISGMRRMPTWVRIVALAAAGGATATGGIINWDVLGPMLGFGLP